MMEGEVQGEEKDWEVENIIGKRVKDGVVEYLLKWKGYSAAESTWEDEDSCKGLVLRGDP